MNSVYSELITVTEYKRPYGQVATVMKAIAPIVAQHESSFNCIRQVAPTRAPPGGRTGCMCAQKKFLTNFFVVLISTASLLEVVFRHFRV